MQQHNEKHFRPKNKHWNKDKIWKHPIKSTSGAKRWVNWVIAIIVLGITIYTSLPILIEGFPKTIEDIITVLLTGFASLAFTSTAIKTSKDWSYYGATPLSLDLFPALLGNKLKGKIKLTRDISGTIASVTLKCVKKSRASGERNYTKTLWSQDSEVAIKSDGEGAHIFFEFDIPSDQEETKVLGTNSISWVITVSFSDQNQAYNREFHIPVFRGSVFEKSSAT